VLGDVKLQFHPTHKNKAYILYSDTLTYLNMAFTAMFLVESILKILAFGFKVWTTLDILMLLFRYCLKPMFHSTQRTQRKAAARFFDATQ